MVNKQNDKTPLFDLSANREIELHCPKCDFIDHQKRSDIVFDGKFILIKSTCQRCNEKFIQTLPTGHIGQDPISLSEDGRHLHYLSKQKWLAIPLQKALSHKPVQVKMKSEIIRSREGKQMILHHMLDDCYGHVLVRSINIWHVKNQYPNHHIVALIPSNIRWLVPEDRVDEIWMVDTKMDSFLGRLDGLDSFIKSKIPEFDRVSLSLIDIHPDILSVPLSKFLQTKPFSLSFGQPASVTFIWREDRFWHSRKFERFFQLVSIKMGWTGRTKKYFSRRQLKRVKKLFRELKKILPEITFSVMGLGKTGVFEKSIQDLRVKHITRETEQQWCEKAASSHIVVGIHGSNMLIPTALAAGFIELLPVDKRVHIGEDILQEMDPENLMKNQRFVDPYINPAKLAQEIGTMYSDLVL